MLQEIETVLRDRCGLKAPAPIVVGVSGGADSLCLLHVLRTLGFRSIAAYFDHQLRPESSLEAAEVQSVAADLDAAFVTERADVQAQARSKGLSIEEAARDLRYAFLFSKARELGAQAVAVGHTADDQVETVLMHLIRGAGMRGLKGMSYRSVLPIFDRSIPLVRPLLGIWRRETVDYCHSNALQPRHDSSNDSLEFFRNRVRHELIPQLETYNPRVREALWRTAESLASDLALVEERANQAWHQLVLRQTAKLVSFDAGLLAGESIALQRRLLLMAADNLVPDAELGFETLERATALIADSASRRLDLGSGLALFREGHSLNLVSGDLRVASEDWPQMPGNGVSIPLQTPVTVPLANGWCFTSMYGAIPEATAQLAAGGADRYSVYLDADTLPASLELRTPQPGDRFQPLGMHGHSQKLSDFFVNAKLPARVRRQWPLLCSGKMIVWVPGFRPADAFRFQAKTRQAVCFAVTRPS